MSPSTAIQRILQQHAGAAARLPGGPAWTARRAEAMARLQQAGLPNRRDENWKYLDHARIEALDFALAPAAKNDTPGANGIQIDGLAALMAREPTLAAGLLPVPGDTADERYALLAEAFTHDGTLIRIAGDTAPSEALRINHAVPLTGARHQRMVVQVGAGAKLTLIEHVTPDEQSQGLLNFAANLQIGADAQLRHVRLIEAGAGATHVETISVQQSANSRYEQILFVLGGRTVRSTLQLSLAGRGASSQLSGLFMVDGERQADLYTRVEHVAPATMTVQDYRGIGADRGRGAFNGRIVVRPEGAGADSRQSSRNLLLTPLAEINARPQLEIMTDDVRCQHGATIGTLDPTQLFYLLSRGLDPETARGLLTFAFCEDIILGLKDPALRSYVEERVVGRLPDRDLIRSFR